MARILLLGPDKQRATGTRQLLRQDGHQVTWLRSLDRWACQERELLPDVVVAAVGSVEGVLSPGARHGFRGFPAPLLFVQQEADFLPDLYIQERFVDRLASPFLAEELLGRIDALVRVRRVIRRDAVDGESTAEGPTSRHKIRSFGRYVSSWVKNRLPREEASRSSYLEVAARVAEWADRRDAFEFGHAERVSSFCAMIAEGLRFDEQETLSLLRAAMLHDVGKVAVPVEILHQTQPLEDSQRRLIRTHPARGAALLRALDPDESVARTVQYHHERPDGSGYYGLERDRVPRAAYALAVAETYDAMTSSLLGRTLTSQAALSLLAAGKGTAHDADCVEALVEALRPRSNCIPLARLSPTIRG